MTELKPKWDVTLSTTEPFNNIGLIKVRKNNVGTESIKAKVTENNTALDLTGLKIYFCAYFENFVAVEQEAKIINAQKGELIYVLNQHDMQGKLRFAYFKFTKGDKVVGTTQNFGYIVDQSIENSCVDANSYIQRLEDVLNLFLNIEEEATKEIQAMIDNFNQQVIEQQISFEKWFEQIKEIIEDIDPGGKLLLEIINARESKLYGRTFKTLSERLEFMDNEGYSLDYKMLGSLTTLRDDQFSINNKNTKVGTVNLTTDKPGLVIAEIGNVAQDTFYLKKVGEV